MVNINHWFPEATTVGYRDEDGALLGLKEEGSFIKIEKGIDVYEVHIPVFQKRMLNFFIFNEMHASQK